MNLQEAASAAFFCARNIALNRNEPNPDTQVSRKEMQQDENSNLILIYYYYFYYLYFLVPLSFPLILSPIPFLDTQSTAC